MTNTFEKKELLFQNDLGGFDLEQGEYVITHGAAKITPRPWANVIANEHFGTIVTESSLGTTWFDNSKDKRISSWSNDTVQDTPSEVIYIKDNDSGEFWTVTRLPVGSPEQSELEDAYRTRHGAGYTVYESNTSDIGHEMKVFVDVHDPVKVISLSLKNTSGKKRNLSLYHYVDVVMGNFRNQFGSFVEFNYQQESDAVEVRRSDKQEFNKHVFIASDRKISSWTDNKNGFIGYMGSLKNPQGLRQNDLNEGSKYPKDNCSVIKVNIELLPESQDSVTFLLGAAENAENQQFLLNKYRKHESVEESLRTVKDFWKNTLGRFAITTPDTSMDLMINQWAAYQTLSCRFWGRSSHYQSSGAYGFRDQLQDSMAFVYLDPSLCREHILRAAARQFEEGDVQHWWFGDSSLGVRNKVADSPLWLAFVTDYYIEKTGDTSILAEVVPYLKGHPLSEQVNAYVEVPAVSEIQESLWDHCLKAIQKVCDFGIHGIPLIKEGDWNDGMNLVGEQGKGESIWLGWFLGTVLKSFIRRASERNEQEVAEKLSNLFNNLQISMHNSAWDGDWYLRAYTDEGHKLGTSTGVDCRIDSISQSWSVLSGMDDIERQETSMNSAINYLVDPKNELAMLLYPAFDNDPMNPGYIKDYVPGIRENGGQYSHAAFWLVMALAKQRKNELATRILSYTNPIHRTNTNEKLYIYELEPYVIGGDIYSSGQHMAKGGWSWYTASSGLYYRTVIESIIGFKLLGDKLMFEPCVPQDWKEFSVRYQYKSAVYTIHFTLREGHTNTVVKMICDGSEVASHVLDLKDDAGNHNVIVSME